MESGDTLTRRTGAHSVEIGKGQAEAALLGRLDDAGEVRGRDSTRAPLAHRLGLLAKVAGQGRDARNRPKSDDIGGFHGVILGDELSPSQAPHCPASSNHNWRMKTLKPMSSKDYKQGVARRLKHLRENAQLTQTGMASALGMGLDRYKKYESGRSVMPPWDVVVLLTLTGAPPWWFLTGAGEPPKGMALPSPLEDPLIRKAVQTLQDAPAAVRARVVPQIALLCAQTSTASPARQLEMAQRLGAASRKARKVKV